MPSINTVRNTLPPFRNHKELIKKRQSTNDIIAEMLNTHRQYESDYDRLVPLFDTGNIYTTCQGIWNFLKHNLRYNEESDLQQSVKSPAAIVHDGDQVDCKHYSLFAGGILDAIKRQYDDPWTWSYRFVTDNPNVSEPTHVFVVCYDRKNEIWIDPCLSSFNYKKRWLINLNRQPMALVRISGTQPQKAQSIQVLNPAVAWTSFLTMVNTNMFGLKDLLKQNGDITAGALKNYCQSNGYDYEQLMNFLAA